jgi:hypothetical protein
MPLYHLDPPHSDLLVYLECQAVACPVPLTPPVDPGTDPSGTMRPAGHRRVAQGEADHSGELGEAS